ncbi:chemotaxis protein CheW [Azospirillum melinis]|uniref:Chemotaxis protein CheW n=1 Tax=Azospirillum melinis TaxID=328839 RepID=A0ABX2KU57_9PROT|nr:chemotaxis protein CheW [Azospirillum melinis]MBP2308278.1 purine-binding chemotaxis protein CheW [Azospirillum melinis]NUB03399.1 chemotaxis protein CheW [Azospirillum melinis]
MDETLAGTGAAPLIAALDSASPDRAASRASGRASIDWNAVREKVAHRTADLEATFAGRGPWADAVLARRAQELAEVPQLDGEAGTGTPMLVARGAETLYGLELRHLGHIVPMPRLARVPGAPPAILGVIAVAGKVMRLFDLDSLCSGTHAGAAGIDQPGGYAIVLRTGTGRPAALRLHEVERVADIVPPRTSVPAEAGPLVRAITADRMAILDMAALLDLVKT